VARVTGRTSSEGAVLDLLADYLSHTVVFALIWLKVFALTELANDGFSVELGGLFALTAGGWFASLHNQALNASAESGTGILKSHIGGTKVFLILSQGRHVMDTSLAITALAIAMALDGYALLGVLMAVSAVRLGFLVARFVGLLLISSRKDLQTTK
jgi:phosphatidylglycerophosphate synthase